MYYISSVSPLSSSSDLSASRFSSSSSSSSTIPLRLVSGRGNVSLRCSVFGIPAASVSWWHGNRLVANASRLEHAWEAQFYAVLEHRANAHQVRIGALRETKVILYYPTYR